MKSIEKLRESLKDCTSEAGTEPNRFDTYWITARACDMLIDEIEAEITELLDAEKEKTAAANKAINEATGKWAKADAENRELKKMLLIDDGTVEDYTERLDLQAALDRQKALTDEFHEGWSEYRKACLELEEENDRLKREIAEKYMELPVDADGVPIRVGDKVTYGCGEIKEVSGVGFGCYFVERQDPWDYESRWPSECRHVKPRTVEDVLREMLDRNSDGIGLREFNRDFNAFVEHYADEIRELMEAGE